MKQVRVQRRTRVETAIERRDRVASILDLDPRDPDILRAKALPAAGARRGPEEARRWILG